MKHLLVTLLLLLTSFLGFGQSVSAPDSKSFIPSTTGQDASGFVLSGFSSTATLLASISLVNPPSGTTFVLNTTTHVASITSAGLILAIPILVSLGLNLSFLTWSAALLTFALRGVCDCFLSALKISIASNSRL